MSDEPASAATDQNPLAPSVLDPRPGPIEAPYVARTPQPPPEPRVLGWRFFLAVAAGAIVVDVALRRPPWNNVATSLAFIVIAGALVASGRLSTASSRVTVTLAVVLGSFVWFRTDPILVTVDLLLALTLVWYAAIHGTAGTMWNVGPARLLVRLMETVVTGMESIVDGPIEIAARWRRARSSGFFASELGAQLARGAALAAPLLLVLGLLLASADVVFASFFDVGLGIDVPSILGHAVLLLLGAFAMVLLLRIAGTGETQTATIGSNLRLGHVETLVVLVGLDLLFAGFAIAQAIAKVGNVDPVLADAGLTHKEYARQGFFQLLWVAGITVLVLVILNTVTRHLNKGQRRPVVVASLVAIGFTLLIVAVAFGRLQLYIRDDGLTPLRFYSSAFSIWIAVVFVLLAVRLLGRRSDRSWLTSAVGLSGVVFLIGLNVANPERIIAENNLQRDEGSLLYHMDKLSADGRIVLFDGLDRLSEPLRTGVQQRLCAETDDELDFDRTGLGFNMSEERLERRIDRECVDS